MMFLASIGNLQMDTNGRNRWLFCISKQPSLFDLYVLIVLIRMLPHDTDAEQKKLSEASIAK